MQVLRLKSRVSTDRRLHLDIPVNVEPGDVELVLVVNNFGETKTGDLAGIIGSAKGSFSTPREADEFLARERNAWG